MSKLNYSFTAIPKYFYQIGWMQENDPIKFSKRTKFLNWSLAKCSTKERSLFFNGKIITLDPMEFIYGRNKSSKETGMTPKQLRYQIEAHLSMGFLEKSNKSKKNCYTIYKWRIDNFKINSLGQPRGQPRGQPDLSMENEEKEAKKGQPRGQPMPKRGQPRGQPDLSMENEEKEAKRGQPRGHNLDSRSSEGLSLNKTTTTPQTPHKEKSRRRKFKKLNEQEKRAAEVTKNEFKKFSKKPGDDWDFPIEKIEIIIAEHGIEYVISQAKYMITQEKTAIKDENLPYKKRKSNRIDRPYTYLKLACEKNYANA